MRLFFAWLVIVTHSYELLEGNRTHAPLFNLIGTLSSGELAVDAFFIISGYLISYSWTNKPRPIRFMLHRIGRIVPGFIICLVLSLTIYIICFDQNYLERVWWGGFLSGLIILKVRGLPAVFPNTYYPSINGSLWTIHFEFFCYVGIFILGIVNLLKKPFISALYVLLTVLYISLLSLDKSSSLIKDLEYFTQWVRLSGCYSAGVIWFLYDVEIRYYTKKYIWLISILFVSLLFHSIFYIFSINILLPFLLCYIAYEIKIIKGFWITHDISYGVYLYAWPIQKITINSWPGHINPVLLILVTTIASAFIGWLSWLFIERPAMAFARKFENSITQVIKKYSA